MLCASLPNIFNSILGGCLVRHYLFIRKPFKQMSSTEDKDFNTLEYAMSLIPIINNMMCTY